MRISFVMIVWEHIQVEVFIGKGRATEIAEKIMEVAHTGGDGDGIVAVIPVESVTIFVPGKNVEMKCVN